MALIWIILKITGINGPVTLHSFLSNLSCSAWKFNLLQLAIFFGWVRLGLGRTWVPELLGMKNEKYVYASLLKLPSICKTGCWRGDTYIVQWCCQLLQSVAKSRAEFYFMQSFIQQRNCKTTHVTLCNSLATGLAMALWEKLLRKLHSVTGPWHRLQVHA